jgi:hypothetical protein
MGEAKKKQNDKFEEFFFILKKHGTAIINSKNEFILEPYAVQYM